MSKILSIKYYDRVLTHEEIRDVYNGVDFEQKYKREKIKKDRIEKLKKLDVYSENI